LNYLVKRDESALARSADTADVSLWTAADRYVSPETLQDIWDSVPANTRRAYARIWDGRSQPDHPAPDPLGGFAGWCGRAGRSAMPATPETLAEYVKHLAAADAGPATIEQAIAAIRTRHRLAGFGRHYPDAEAAQRVLKTHRRNRAIAGKGGVRKATPVVVEGLRKMVSTINQDSVLGIRDHALLLLGIALFGRRSELAALTWADVAGANEGMTVTIRMSKTDQDAKGAKVPVLWGTFPGTNPVRVISRWREVLADHGITDGPLLRTVTPSGRIKGAMSVTTINRIVKRRVQLAGLDGSFSAHSLRAGGATIAYMNKAPIAEICRIGRWEEGSPVVLGYIRAVDEWQDHPFRGAL
jgi:integrase